MTLELVNDDWMYERDPEHDDGQVKITDWGVDKFLGTAPPIDWLIEGILGRGVPGLVCSLGGIGKSYLMLDVCIRIAAEQGMSPNFALGGRIPKRGKAVFITAEDSMDAIHRRLNQLVPDEMEKLKLLNHLFIIPLSNTAEGTKPLMRFDGGTYSMTDAWWNIYDQVVEMDNVALVVLDPLQALAGAGDLNADPAAAQAFWTSVTKLCSMTGCSVLATHHMRKDGSRDVDGPLAAREGIRGTTALVDSCRFVWAGWLPSASTREAVEQVVGEPLNEMSVVQGCVVKSNDIGMSSVRPFVRDTTGLLIDRTEQISQELDARRHLSDEQIMQTFGAVSTRWNDGDPFSHHAAAKSRYLGSWMCSHFDLTKQAAKEYISEWLAQGRLVKEPHPKIQRAQGLRFET